MPEDRKTSIELSPDLWRRVRIRAAERDMSLKELLTEALEMYLKAKPKKGGPGAHAKKK